MLFALLGLFELLILASAIYFQRSTQMLDNYCPSQFDHIFSAK